MLVPEPPPRQRMSMLSPTAAVHPQAGKLSPLCLIIKTTNPLYTTQVFLTVLLIPVGFVAYACVAFGSKWELYLSYRFSHSNPHVRIFYLSWEARDILRSRVYSTRTDNSPEAGDTTAQASVPTAASTGDSALASNAAPQ